MLTNLKETRTRWTYFLKHSCRLTMLSCLSWRSILTSRIVVFFTISSSSDSLNFLIATEDRGGRQATLAIKFDTHNYPDRSRKESKLTDFARLLVSSHEDLPVGALADDALQFVLLHALHAGGLRLCHLIERDNRLNNCLLWLFVDVFGRFSALTFHLMWWLILAVCLLLKVLSSINIINLINY